MTCFVKLVVNTGREKKEYPVRRGTRLLDALAKAGIGLELACGGRGICGGCRLLLQGDLPAPTPEEKAYFSPALLARGWRLACLTTIEGDTEVIITPDSSRGAATFVLGAKARAEEVAAAVDMGTTTLAVTLVEPESGRRLVTAGRLNPQTAKGSDIITRMQQALSPEGKDLLQKMLVSGINILIEEAAAKAGSKPEQITTLVAAGNSVISHLFLGLPVESLSRAPFRPAFKGAYTATGAELGLAVHPRALIYLVPLIGGFVGGDATAALLATGLAAREGKNLLVDLGTNGEIILAVNGRLWATSAAAGPAFEGQGITWGMRAEPGAITGLETGGRWRLKTVNGIEPRGISGSGLVEIAAALLAAGLLTAEGRLKNPEELSEELPPETKERVRVTENGPEVLLDRRTGITITQKDIRLLQLAKGAVRAAVESLLEEAGITAGDLDRVFLAGAFGSGLSPAAALKIGLLPPVALERIEFVGNAALEGATLALEPEKRKAMERLARETCHISLETKGYYQEKFINALYFPVETAKN